MGEPVLRNRRVAVCEADNAFGILFGTVQSILKDNLKMRRIAAKLVHCLLSEQQEIRVNTCQGLQERLERGPKFPLKIIADDRHGFACVTQQPTVISLEEHCLKFTEIVFQQSLNCAL
jgi:hypothetical protein